MEEGWEAEALLLCPEVPKEAALGKPPGPDLPGAELPKVNGEEVVALALARGVELGFCDVVPEPKEKEGV